MIDNSDYVSYEVADELNTAGFSETSLGKYVEMLAPSLWQAAKWLRGRGYIISVEPFFSKHIDSVFYIGRLYSIAERREIYSCSGDCTHEKAWSMCMQKALQLINY